MTINIGLEGLTAWIKSKNITAHSVAVLAIAAATAITTDEQVRSFVMGVFQAHPKILAGITSAAVIILKYSRSSSSAGAVAVAQSIQASPNPPTQAAVTAAQVDTTVPAQPKEIV